MNGASLILAGLPNPVDWVVDEVKGFVGAAAAAGLDLVIGGLTAWMLDAVMWVVGGVFNFFLDATDPNVQADWFIAGDGPYATTVTIGATLLVGFVLIGITQSVLAGDVGGMLRRISLELPMAVLGMVGLVTVTQALIALTDQLADGLLSRFAGDVERFTATVGSLSALSGGTATAFVVFLLALVSVLAGIVLVAELVIRASLIYIVVALAPLVFAAMQWPAVRGAGRKLLELLVALIVSKLVVAVALAVAASAAVGAGAGGEVTALPPPEVVAENPGGSVTQAVRHPAGGHGRVRRSRLLAAAGGPAPAHHRGGGCGLGHPGRSPAGGPAGHVGPLLRAGGRAVPADHAGVGAAGGGRGRSRPGWPWRCRWRRRRGSRGRRGGGRGSSGCGGPRCAGGYGDRRAGGDGRAGGTDAARRSAPVPTGSARRRPPSRPAAAAGTRRKGGRRWPPSVRTASTDSTRPTPPGCSSASGWCSVPWSAAAWYWPSPG